MRYPLMALAATTLALAACSPAEQNEAEADAAVAGDELSEEASQVGDAIESGVQDVADSEAAAEIREEAGQLGDAIESGARNAAENVDQATDEMAADARQREAERQAAPPAQ